MPSRRECGCGVNPVKDENRMNRESGVNAGVQRASFAPSEPDHTFLTVR
jgi:hypothetical protein